MAGAGKIIVVYEAKDEYLGTMVRHQETGGQTPDSDRDALQALGL